ncbi:hypothetical protein SBF1_4740008 [Candidatus Desulfosporosinus infrequens]|uniref:Uncharacterized protein n=1 Tax=Candidatus Desulfosporosinus infrequens TaxID=2043169 RepID=A0A2U3LEQ2_9FIRM|nr:hypothetical protein SBF1_4740008 [Candidatus Desulfosporosinus infrequens]
MKVRGSEVLRDDKEKGSVFIENFCCLVSNYSMSIGMFKPKGHNQRPK